MVWIFLWVLTYMQKHPCTIMDNFETILILNNRTSLFLNHSMVFSLQIVIFFYYFCRLRLYGSLGTALSELCVLMANACKFMVHFYCSKFQITFLNSAFPIPHLFPLTHIYQLDVKELEPFQLNVNNGKYIWLQLKIFKRTCVVFLCSLWWTNTSFKASSFVKIYPNIANRLNEKIFFSIEYCSFPIIIWNCPNQRKCWVHSIYRPCAGLIYFGLNALESLYVWYSAQKLAHFKLLF